MEVKIDSLNNFGVGIAIHNNKSYNVPYALPGEIIKVDIVKDKNQSVNAKLIGVIQASDMRKQNIECPYYYKCGGCNLLHLKTEHYNYFKKNILAKGLARLKYNEDFEFITIKEFSRRRVTLHARKINNNLTFGFYTSSSSEIINIESCLLLEKEIIEILPVIRQRLNQFDSSILSDASDLKIIITQCSNGLDILFKSKFPINKKTSDLLADFPINIIRITWQQDSTTKKEQVLFLQKEPMIKIGDFEVQYPVNAFLQVSNDSQNIIINFLKEHTTTGATILDLFSGIGTYTLPLSNLASHITSVEGELNTKAFMKNNIKYIQQDLYHNPIKAKKISTYDEVVINPPRNGASPQIKEIAKSGIKKVFFVSCDIHTFIRDALVLQKKGYILEKVLGVDQFLYSHHIEIIAIFKLSYSCNIVLAQQIF